MMIFNVSKQQFAIVHLEPLVSYTTITPSTHVHFSCVLTSFRSNIYIWLSDRKGMCSH